MLPQQSRKLTQGPSVFEKATHVPGGADIPVCRKRLQALGRQECLPHLMRQSPSLDSKTDLPWPLTDRCCHGGAAHSAPARRACEFAAGASSIGVWVLMPKCPICLAATWRFGPVQAFPLRRRRTALVVIDLKRRLVVLGRCETNDEVRGAGQPGGEMAVIGVYRQNRR